MIKGISEYRDTNYTTATVRFDKNEPNYIQCKLSLDLDIQSLWIHERHEEYPDGFLEFKTNGEWDGRPWRIIQIGPSITIVDLNNLIENIQIVPKDDVRNYKKWNK